MEPTNSPGSSEQPKEQRILAAIVFTDAVSFSKLAGKDEQAALSILNRDFQLMGMHCDRQGGRVLKTMGDGMLMMFPSAVDAMQAALNIQDALYTQAQKLPSVSVLQHRIGVHLGDIIINGDDVFGDGVNVASRLQTEAKPSAICYSRTVADVIKNKVQVTANYLGPRVLKNIAEPVMVWQVPPIGGDAGVIDAAAFSDIRPDDEGARGSKALLLVVASIVLVAVAIGALSLIRPGPPTPISKKNSHLKQPVETAKPEKVVDAAPTPPPQPTGTIGGDPPMGAALLPADLQPKLADLRRNYDFAAMRDALTPYVDEKSGEIAKLREKYDQLAHFTNWLQIEVLAATETNPIPASLAGANVLVYAGKNGIAIDTAGTIAEVRFNDLPPSTILGVAKALLVKTPTGDNPPPMTSNWISTFTVEYNL